MCGELCNNLLGGCMGEAAEDRIHLAVVDVLNLDQLGDVGGSHQMREDL